MDKRQAQADGNLTTALCSLPKIISEDGQDYVQLYDVLETVRGYLGDCISKQQHGVGCVIKLLQDLKPSVAMPTKTGHCEWQTEDENLYVIHELKILPEYYDEVVTGRKNFELRKDDRNYKVGDMIRFHEYKDGEYTGKESILIPILYILRNCPEYGLMDGYCILGL